MRDVTDHYIKHIANSIEYLENHEPELCPAEIIEEMIDYYNCSKSDVLKAYKIARRHEIALEKYHANDTPMTITHSILQ